MTPFFPGATVRIISSGLITTVVDLGTGANRGSALLDDGNWYALESIEPYDVPDHASPAGGPQPAGDDRELDADEIVIALVAAQVIGSLPANADPFSPATVEEAVNVGAAIMHEIKARR